MSEPVAEAMTKMRQFMFERVYTNKEAKSEETEGRTSRSDIIRFIPASHGETAG